MLQLKGAVFFLVFFCAQIFPSTSPPKCGAACAPLADYEWLGARQHHATVPVWGIHVGRYEK